MGLQSTAIFALFVIAGFLAWNRGGAPERVAAGIIVAWIASDAAYHLLFGPSGFDRLDPVHLVLDGAQLVAIVWVALRANRIWPLFAAAAQMMCVSGHLAVSLEPEGARRAYWAMTQLPQYIQLAALLAGAVAHARRERLLGPYRSWRAA